MIKGAASHGYGGTARKGVTALLDLGYWLMGSTLSRVECAKQGDGPSRRFPAAFALAKSKQHMAVSQLLGSGGEKAVG